MNVQAFVTLCGREEVHESKSRTVPASEDDGESHAKWTRCFSIAMDELANLFRRHLTDDQRVMLVRCGTFSTWRHRREHNTGSGVMHCRYAKVFSAYFTREPVREGFEASRLYLFERISIP